MRYYQFNTAPKGYDKKGLSKKEVKEKTPGVLLSVNHDLGERAFLTLLSVLRPNRLHCCLEVNDLSLMPEYVVVLLSKGFGIQYDLSTVTEITLGEYFELVEDADPWANKAQDPFTKGLSRYQFYRSDIKESLLKEGPPDKDAAIRQVASFPNVQGLVEELGRIYDSPVDTFMGNPVHYVINIEDTAERSAVRNLLISSLLVKKRLLLARVWEVCPEDMTYLDAGDLAGFIDRQSFGAVVLKLPRSGPGSDYLSDSDGTLGHFAPLIKEKQRKILFIIEYSRKSERGWKYLHSLLDGITFVELKEKALLRDEALAYVRRLGAEDGLVMESSLESVINASAYSMGEVRDLYSSWYMRHLCKDVFTSYADLPCQLPLEAKDAGGSAYEKLSKMIGLDEVRRVILEAVDYAKAEVLYEKAGVKLDGMTRHMVFTGNPGTAKTTCARLYAAIMKENGILPKGKFVEVGRKDIVSKYLGGTAPLVKEFFEKADGGVLFIDEAYSLVEERNGLYGDEAINTIVQEMENHRDSVVVIFAGYPDEMERFLAKNPGLRSRISFHVHFKDYTVDELMDILRLFVSESKMVLDDVAEPKLRRILEHASQEPGFGNGRFARNLFEQARLRQASRLIHQPSPGIDEIKTLLADDFLEPERKKEERRIGFVL